MMTATGTRAQARESLKGKWGKGALIVLSYAIIEFVLNYIINSAEHMEGLKALLQIVVTIITVPLSFGLIISFMKLHRNEEVNTFDFLTLGFSRFSRAWMVELNMLLKLILPIILMIVSIIILAGAVIYNANDVAYNSPDTQSFLKAVDNLEVNQRGDINLDFSTLSRNTPSSIQAPQSNPGGTALVVIGTILFIVSSVYYYVKSLLYALTFNIAYDEPELSALEVCNKSKEMMTGNRGNYFVLTLSFIGWALLACLTLGIGFFWLIPYIQVAFVCFYEELRKGKAEPKAEENVENA